MTKTLLSCLLSLTLLACGAPDPELAAAATPTATVHHRFDGLIAVSGVAALPRGDLKAVTGYPGKSFHLGAITDEQTWRKVKPAIPKPFPAVDWSRQMIVFAVLDAQTNALQFLDWKVDPRGVATLSIEWSGIEPFYPDHTPGVFVLVDRASIQKVEVVSTEPGATKQARLGEFRI